MIGIGLTALALAWAPLLPVAQDNSQTVEVGEWMIGPVSNDACQMVAAFGDHVMVSISENAQGVGHFVFSDDRWLLKEGDPKPATLSWDGWRTSANVKFTAHATPSGRWVLMLETDAGFTENLAGSRHFWLRVPGVEFDDDFAVPDASDVLTAVATCNSKL